MSVHSNFYETEEEYERDLKHEYAREGYEMYHYDDDEVESPTCGDCVHCRRGQGYSHEIVDTFGSPLIEGKKYGKYAVYIHIVRTPRGYIYMCDNDPNNLIQVDTWKSACEAFQEP